MIDNKLDKFNNNYSLPKPITAAQEPTEDKKTWTKSHGRLRQETFLEKLWSEWSRNTSDKKMQISKSGSPNIQVSNRTERNFIPTRNVNDKRLLKFGNDQDSKDFNKALAAVSAYLSNSIFKREYEPHPPNLNAYNYPTYRGQPREKKPSKLETHRDATNDNYALPPYGKFERYNFKKEFAPNSCGLSFLNAPNAFYSHPNIYLESEFNPFIKFAQ